MTIMRTLTLAAVGALIPASVLAQAATRRLAGIINVAYASTLNYRIEFADQPAKGQKPVAPQVRVSRQGVELKAVSFL
jgi:hypothetical protein